MRRFPLRDAILLFDRDTGTNVLCEGAETKGLVAVAPRVIQFAITNRCNLACTFCSRDVDAASAWTADTAFAMLAGLAEAGVLEVAFGGGEPFAFKGFAQLVRRLYDETPLAVNVTTNGLLVTGDKLAAIAGAYGQLRLSLYDDNDWRARIARFVAAGARFGVNYLVTPARLAELDTTLVELAALGCRDILLLSYNGDDRALHLSTAETMLLGAQVRTLARALPGVRIALDVCWGERLEAVPRLFAKPDCGAGSEFLVVTSDARVMPCSFHDASFPAATAEAVMAIWRSRQREMSRPATQPGCARTPGFGLGRLT
ncbi:MAG TPA: radical SAM protein [Kofleriaceae bacterium]